MVLSVPFLDDTSVTSERIWKLFALSLAAGLVAEVYGYDRRLAPLMNLDFWRTELAPGSSEATRVASGGAGFLALATVLAVLAYGVTHGYVFGGETDGTVLAFTIGLVVAAVASAIGGVAIGLRSASGRMTLIYTLVTVGWVAVIPLVWLLRSPWNLLLVLVLVAVGSVLLTIFCTRWHAGWRLAQVNPADVRLAVGETRFPRHMARWFGLALYTAVVYTTAFALTDTDDPQNFERIWDALMIVLFVLLLTNLLWCIVCSHSCRKVSQAPPTSQVRSAPQAAGMLDARQFVAQGEELQGGSDDGLEHLRLGGRRRK